MVNEDASEALPSDERGRSVGHRGVRSDRSYGRRIGASRYDGLRGDVVDDRHRIAPVPGPMIARSPQAASPMMRVVSLLPCLAATTLVGCASLPTAGPTTSQVLDQEKAAPGRYDIVNIDALAVAAMSARPPESLRNRFDRYGKASAERIGVGDMVAVSVWDASGTALFGGGIAGGKEATAGAPSPSGALPEQVVGPDGGITVPMAGRVKAAGRTPLQVQTDIQKQLADRAIEPQAIVTVTKNVSATVTVTGDVNTAARVPLSVRGDRLLDVIAASGGTKLPIYEAFVRLSRDGTTVTIPMETLVSEPEENIYAWPGDVITLIQAPQTFSVFGATFNNAQIPFSADRINLAQAIAKAGGLLDLRADPTGVFLFRFEPPAVVSALGAKDLATPPGSTTPILYHLDLRDVTGYFIAKRFPIEDGDMIYVANAPFTELQKFLTVVGLLTAPVVSSAGAARVQ